MTDTVFIKGLKTNGIIGVFEWEREVRQSLYIDVTMSVDISQAALTDDLRHTLDYKAITDMIRDFVANTQFQLIETLADKLAEKIQFDFHVVWLQLTVHKPGAIADADDVGISIERGEKP